MMRRFLVVLLLTSRIRAYTLDFAELFSQFAPITNEIQDETCRRDVLSFMQSIQNLELWALKMLDASAKLQSGVMYGNIKFLGVYNECLETVGHNFTGQYCLANVHVNPSKDSTKKDEIMKLINIATLGRRKYEWTINRTNIGIPDLFPSMAMVQGGFCVPSSCSSQEVQIMLNAALKTVGKFLDLDVSVEVLPGQCTISNERPFDAWDVLMFCILGAIFLLAAVGTIIDKTLEDRKNLSTMSQVLQSFSVPANWNRLTDTTSYSSDEFTSIDGMRIISTLWIIIGHKIYYLPQEPLVNKQTIIKSSKDLVFAPLANIPTVETFLLISGMLRSLSTLKALEKGHFKFLQELWRRYLRLTPAHAMTILFYATILPRLGGGPLWKTLVEDAGFVCRDVGYLNLLYVNNYFKKNLKCATQTWYLATDMQLYILAPLLIIPIWKNPRVITPLITCICAVLAIVTFVYIYVTSGIPIYTLGTSDSNLQDHQQNVIMATHMRATPYVMGIALGYIFFKLRNAKLIMNRTAVLCGWCLSLMMLGAVTFSSHEFIQFDREYNAFKSALFGAIHKPIWTVAVAWIIFACHTGYGGIVNRILSAAWLKPLSRLTYCVFLTHYAVLAVTIGRLRTPYYGDEYDLLRCVASDIMVSLAVSVLLYLLVEAPSLQITKIIATRDNSTCNGHDAKRNINEDYKPLTTNLESMYNKFKNS